MDPDGVDSAEGGDVQGMAAGGIVRMQAGGQPPRPISELSEEDLLRYQDYFLNQQRPLISGGRVDRARFARIPAVSSPYDFISIANELDRRAGVTPPQMFSPQNEGAALLPATRADDIYRSVSSLPAFVGEEGGPSVDPQTSATTTTAAQPPTPTTTTTPPPPTPTTTTTPPPVARAARPAAPQPAQGSAPQVQGIEGLRNAPTGIPEGSQLPTMAELMRQNAALFPDGMGGIRDRMREERVDPAARRNEAINMALIEAGLRIAGSNNPSLVGAIGEGALPAVQGYSQQLGQIRSEQRQARQDELELAKQETNRQFAIGQISAAEYRSRMDNINANLRANAQERGANARAAALEAGADRRAAAAAASAEASDRRRGFITPEEYSRMTPEERETFRELRGMGRPADVAGSQGVLRTVTTDLRDLRTRLSELNSSEPSRTTGIWGRDNPAYARWLQEKAAIEAQIADQERLRRFHEGVLQTGRAGAQASSTTARPNATNPSDPFGLR